jgi:hypothetical protein
MAALRLGPAMAEPPQDSAGSQGTLTNQQPDGEAAAQARRGLIRFTRSRIWKFLDELVQLRETLLEHQGPCVVSLHLFAPGKGETVIELPDQVRVASTPELEATVQRLFGSRVSFHSLES